MTDVVAPDRPSDHSLVLIHLLRGPLYRESHEKLWDALLRLRSTISDFFATIGLLVEIDEAEGFAYARGRPDDGEEAWPRLVARRTLGFNLSLLLALLRKRLAEFDATSSDARLVMSRDQIVEVLRIYLPERSHETRVVDDVLAQVEKAVDLGFLRRMPGEPPSFEVRRILRAFVDGQWLHEFDARLGEYVESLSEQVADR